MQCEVCLKRIITKRNFNNYFSIEIHHICDFCYQKHRLSPQYIVIPIEQGLIYLQVLLRTEFKTTPLAHMSFIKPFILQYLKYHRHDTILYFDELDDSIFEMIDLLKVGNVYVLTLYDNRKEKGEIL
jgi:hypothetical protein